MLISLSDYILMRPSVYLRAMNTFSSGARTNCMVFCANYKMLAKPLVFTEDTHQSKVFIRGIASDFLIGTVVKCNKNIQQH
jgi:hypothetical protein